MRRCQCTVSNLMYVCRVYTSSKRYSSGGVTGVLIKYVVLPVAVAALGCVHSVRGIASSL